MYDYSSFVVVVVLFSCSLYWCLYLLFVLFFRVDMCALFEYLMLRGSVLFFVMSVIILLLFTVPVRAFISVFPITYSLSLLWFFPLNVRTVLYSCSYVSELAGASSVIDVFFFCY